MKLKTGVVFTIMVFTNFTIVIQSMKLIAHKFNVTYVNHNYVEYVNAFITRYGRRSDYYLNLQFKKYNPWGNNVTYNLVVYEYLHNEYRRSFVEMHVGLCDLLHHDIFVGEMFKKFNFKCPVFENEFEMLNITVPAKFPYKFPFEEVRVDAYGTRTDNQEVIASGSLFCNLKS